MTGAARAARRSSLPRFPMRLPTIRGLIDRDTIAARPPGIWRYLELLPVEVMQGVAAIQGAPPHPAPVLGPPARPCPGR